MMKLLIPPGSFKAYLFDCDGTIADSMPIHYQAWVAALSPWGARFSEEDFYAWAGMSTPAIVDRLNREQGLFLSAAQVSQHKEDHYFRLLPQIKAVPEVLEQIHLRSGRSPLAVVSGSPRDSVIRTLACLDLLGHFEVIIGAEDYTHGKPAPDCYLLAANRLGVAAAECLVFEDAELGMESARRAGMAAVKVVPTSQEARL